MKLTTEQQSMLDGNQGHATQKAMEIIATLGTIYGAESLLPVTSVQVAGVSYDNLGEAGLLWLDEMANGGGRVRVFTTLNPAGMDVDNWLALGIDPIFAKNQKRVIEAFALMGIVTTCSCTPYLVGNLPHFGEHIAWSESSAVCYANSVLGARTNREGGPSALAAALTGFTPAYGLHLDENRQPSLTIEVGASLSGTYQFGALGMLIGRHIESMPGNRIPYIRGIASASLEQLKSFCASIATYGGVGLFHMEGITPEAGLLGAPVNTHYISAAEIADAVISFTTPAGGEVDFVSLGCPHLSLTEIAHLAELLNGKKVKKTFWVTTARPVKQMADRMGYTRIIEEAGAVFAADTCCVVAPLAGRFHVLATDSAKACYYASGKNKFETVFLPFDEVVKEALR